MESIPIHSTDPEWPEESEEPEEPMEMQERRELEASEDPGHLEEPDDLEERQELEEPEELQEPGGPGDPGVPGYPVGSPLVDGRPKDANTEPDLTVSIVGTRGLRTADWTPGTGKSDAFCVLRIGGKEVYRTRVITDSLEPLWKEQVSIWEWEDDGGGLELAVFDDDLKGSEPLGEVVLPSSEFMKKGFNNDVRLKDPGRGVRAFLRLRVKLAGVELPPGPPMQVNMTIRKEPFKTWGLGLDTQDRAMLFVTEVEEGPILSYNETAGPEQQLRRGDFIGSVNGKTGVTAAMLTELGSAKEVRLGVVRSCRRPILLSRGKDEKRPFGLRLPKKPMGFHLAVLGVESDSFAELHNKQATDEEQKFKAGDHIVSIAGVQGMATDLAKRLDAATGAFQVLVERPVRDEAVKRWEADD